MKEIKINNDIYVLKSELEKIKQSELDKSELQKERDKYLSKYKALYDKYRSLYVRYKTQSDRMSLARLKYIEIIHRIQCEIINKASIDTLIEKAERMSEIEKEL